MLCSEVNNKEIFRTIILNELNEFGIFQNDKNRKEKKPKSQSTEKLQRKRIFHMHLHNLELTEVFLANGMIVQIPKFIGDACSFILENVDVEGIFRKGGSSIRQKQIITNLEAGLPIGKSHHVIDVANVLKYFFRELPDPLIPLSIQETLLRSMLIGENSMKAIFMVLLLLPPLTVNTLAFFMQFLHTVSIRVNYNKMSAENLAIIFTPGLMPFSNMNSHRFSNHVKMIRLLIDNASKIGTIPEHIVNKLQDVENNEDLQKKKRKRRSGSLNIMLNGIKKMVNSAMGGSSENLEDTLENKTTTTLNIMSSLQQQQLQSASTPCIKSAKKRKLKDPVCAFSAKKKKDLISLLPNNVFLPNTPLTKEPKKLRLSIGGKYNTKNMSSNLILPNMERRWSVVGSGWSKNKLKKCSQSIEHLFDGKNNITEETIGDKLSNMELSYPETESLVDNGQEINESSLDLNEENVDGFKSEYKQIKERVIALETKIDQEFNNIRKSILQNVNNSECDSDNINYELTGPERVLNKYQKVVVKTETLISPTTEDLTKRLHRNLRIRRSVENAFRSPSARKIGSIRRRSQDKRQLSRNKTWHISTKSTTNTAEERILKDLKNDFFKNEVNKMDLSPNNINQLEKEQWTAGEDFFKDAKFEKVSNNDVSNFTPIKKINCIPQSDNFFTPMLPPRSAPRKLNSTKIHSNSKNFLTSKIQIDQNCATTPSNEECNGRASIARLRTQNAGMVLAKAKLFDGLSSNQISENEVDVTNTVENPIVRSQQKQVSFNRNCSPRLNRKKEINNTKFLTKSTQQQSTQMKNSDKNLRIKKTSEEYSSHLYNRNRVPISDHLRSSPRVTKLYRECHVNSPRHINNKTAEGSMIKKNCQLIRKSRQLALKSKNEKTLNFKRLGT